MLTSSSSLLFGLVCNQPLDWRSKLPSLTNLQIRELGLFLGGVPLATRREIYRELEKSSVVKIPYVQLPIEADDSEIEYIIQKYSTTIFSLPAVSAAYAVANRRLQAPQTILIENPGTEVAEAEFSEEALNRPGVKGICLDMAVLEDHRLHRPKVYQSQLYALDHHPVLCSVISPLATSWFQRFNKNSCRLTSLTSLRYLHNVPPKYRETKLVLKLDNFFDEQLEVKQYLEAIFGEAV